MCFKKGARSSSVVLNEAYKYAFGLPVCSASDDTTPTVGQAYVTRSGRGHVSVTIMSATTTDGPFRTYVASSNENTYFPTEARSRRNRDYADLVQTPHIGEVGTNEHKKL